MTVEAEAYELSNVVETALAKALAAEAKRWDVVLLIAEELQRRAGGQGTILGSQLRQAGKCVT